MKIKDERETQKKRQKTKTENNKEYGNCCERVRAK